MMKPTKVTSNGAPDQSGHRIEMTYPAPFLHAIDRWQKGGDGAANRKRGERLKKEALKLNVPGLRACGETVYRRLALPQKYIWDFITTGALPEKISSWTVEPDVAKGLKGGVPPEFQAGKRWFGVILARKPTPEEIVLNLDSLWVDLNYQRSLREAKPEQYSEGIRRYENSQREIILEVERVSLKDIVSWGGRSSPAEELAKLALGARATKEQLVEFGNALEENGIAVGARWTSASGARNVTLRVLENAKRRGMPIPQDDAFLP